ncbi:hypothetical protein L3Q67_26865 [Saccharothrix sp. AJ9571]|nr:hypothetical protein L3Q67_26865 [Saccharothrix sp. AJ9571]
MLSSVVRETAIPAAVELLRSNTQFVFPSGTAWVMLLLAAADIGGLSKRHGRDEAKGSIIELIGSDQIKTVATAEMLENEVFGIIPNEETLSRMEEYSLLAGARYAWAVVWQEPSGDLLIDLVSDGTFAQAKAALSGSLGLAEVVGARAWAEHSGMAAEETATAVAPDVQVDDDGGADDEIFDPLPADGVDDEPIFDTEPRGPSAEEGVEPVAVDVDEQTFEETGGFEEFDEADVTYGDTAGPQDSPAEVLLTDQDQVREVIARRFLSEELDLEVRLDEFNATFAIGAPVVQLELPQGATEWLGDQLAQLSRQANADLAQLRSAHEDDLRVLFVRLMSAHAEQIIRDVATDREGSRYKALKDSTEQAHLERHSEKEQRIRETKTRIAKDFEDQATKQAQQAAILAEVQFKERHRPKMQREQADAVAEIDRILENAHTHDQLEILRVRRSDAALKMQVGTTRIFELLAERHTEYLAAEEERLGRWRSEIQSIIDDNRKADVARTEALAEQQRISDEVAVVRREQEALLESLRNEHADRIRRLEEAHERDRREAVAQMQIRDAEWQHSLGVEQERTKSQIGRVAELLHQVDTAESSANRRWGERVSQLKADNTAHVHQLARESEIQGRSIRFLLIVMVALVALVGVAGFIGGAALGG